MATQRMLRPWGAPPRGWRPFANRSLRIAIAAWLAATIVALAIGGESLPFDRPLIAGASMATEVINA